MGLSSVERDLPNDGEVREKSYDENKSMKGNLPFDKHKNVEEEFKNAEVCMCCLSLVELAALATQNK